jgi:hypothetical protein
MRISTIVLVATSVLVGTAPARTQCRPGSNCQAKCDATWQAGGYQSAAQCYAVWAVVNSHGRAYAATKENANRSLGWKRAPGYNRGPIKQ